MTASEEVLLRTKLQQAMKRGDVARFALRNDGGAEILTTQGVRYQTGRLGDTLFVLNRLEEQGHV